MDPNLRALVNDEVRRTIRKILRNDMKILVEETLADIATIMTEFDERLGHVERKLQECEQHLAQNPTKTVQTRLVQSTRPSQHPQYPAGNPTVITFPSPLQRELHPDVHPGSKFNAEQKQQVKERMKEMRDIFGNASKPPVPTEADKFSQNIETLKSLQREMLQDTGSLFRPAPVKTAEQKRQEVEDWHRRRRQR